jgi:hypothetical protein
MKIDIHAHVFPKRGYVRDTFLSVEQQLKANEWFILFSINGFTNEMKKLAASRNDILLCE